MLTRNEVELSCPRALLWWRWRDRGGEDGDDDWKNAPEVQKTGQIKVLMNNFQADSLPLTDPLKCQELIPWQVLNSSNSPINIAMRSWWHWLCWSFLEENSSWTTSGKNWNETHKTEIGKNICPLPQFCSVLKYFSFSSLSQKRTQNLDWDAVPRDGHANWKWKCPIPLCYWSIAF